MLIEHTFVTTLPSSEAMKSAYQFLTNGGFFTEGNGAFHVGETEWTNLDMKRGQKNVRRAKYVLDCPQRIVMQWDRGRITLAATIQVRPTRNGYFYGGRNLYGLSITNNDKVSKKTRDYSDLMILISQALDDLLARRIAPEEARRNWETFEAAQKEKLRKQRFRTWLFAGIFLLLLLGFVAFVFSQISRH